jgi:hypothetical protein
VVLKETISGPGEKAAVLGTELANRILARGGREILDEVYGQV